MPVYEYKCKGTCKGIVIKQRSIQEDDPGYECETCTLPLERVYSSVGAVFNGSGFYSTDNRKQRYTMNTMITEEVVQKEWILKATDRCDSCAAEALVKVTGLNGDLMFCGHHYNKIMDNPEGYAKMMAFMLTIIDERDKLIENKAKGKDY